MAQVTQRFGEERGTWTPALTFATPGDLSVAYTAQVGSWTKQGRLVTVTCVLVTSSFTFTTASGNLQITGLPFTSDATTNFTNYGSLRFGGVTKVGFTSGNAVLAANSSTITLHLSGSAVAPANILAADTPTAGTVDLRFTMTFLI